MAISGASGYPCGTTQAAPGHSLRAAPECSMAVGPRPSGDGMPNVLSILALSLLATFGPKSKLKCISLPSSWTLPLAHRRWYRETIAN